MFKTRTCTTVFAVLVLVWVLAAGAARAEEKSEPGFFERLKNKVLSALDWDANTEHAKEKIKKTKENLEKKNKEPGYKKSVKNIEKIIERSSDNMEKVIDKQSERLDHTLDNLTGRNKEK